MRGLGEAMLIWVASSSGAKAVFGVMDRVREEMLYRSGLKDFLQPSHVGGS
jgi:hypothetical protein